MSNPLATNCIFIHTLSKCIILLLLEEEEAVVVSSRGQQAAALMCWTPNLVLRRCSGGRSQRCLKAAL